MAYASPLRGGSNRVPPIGKAAHSDPGAPLGLVVLGMGQLAVGSADGQPGGSASECADSGLTSIEIMVDFQHRTLLLSGFCLPLQSVLLDRSCGSLVAPSLVRLFGW